MTYEIVRRYAPVCHKCGYKMPLLWDSLVDMEFALKTIGWANKGGQFECIECKEKRRNEKCKNLM